MAISGVGKITDQGLLAKTLAGMNTIGKTAATPAVKETTATKRVNEGEDMTAMQAQLPVAKSELKSPMQLSAATVAKKTEPAVVSEATKAAQSMEVAVQLDIKA